MQRTVFLLATCLTALGLLLASCALAVVPTPTAKPPAAEALVAETQAAKAAAPSPTPKPTAEQPRYGGILTIGAGGDPPSLDPHQETTNYTLNVVAPSYNSIVRYDPLTWPEAKIIPDLAESWQVSPDGKLYTFHFPKGINWHDGTLFTSADAKFSIERIQKPPKGMRSPRSGLFQVVDRVETPDAETLVLRLEKVSASFLPTLAMGWNPVLPRHVIEAMGGDMKKDVVGTGPFRFKSYTTGVGFDSVKNTGYFRKGRPYLDGVRWYIVRDGATRFSALRTGRVLMITPVPGISASEAELVEKSIPNIVAQRKAVTSNYGIQFNLKRAPWDNVKVRQAANLALDREAVIAAALQGRGVMGGLLYPGGSWARPQTELLQKPGYRKPTEADITQAKRLLAEGGFPDGFKSSILARMDMVESYRTAELFQAQMAKLGIDLKIDLKESAVYYDAREKRSFDTFVMGTGLHIDDPDAVFLDCFTTNAPTNYMGYSDSKVDELAEKQSRTMDKAERLKLAWQLEDIIMEANPALISFWVIRIAAHSRELRGYKFAPGISFNCMMEEVWLEK